MECSKVPFYTNAEEKNTKNEVPRSTQPLKIQHSQRSVPVAVCFVPLYANSWPLTAGAQLHSGESNAPVFVPAFHSLRPEVGVNSVLYLCLSPCLAPGGGEVKRTFLWRLRWLGAGRLWVMNGDHAGGLELWKVETKFVLHPGKSGCGQAVASDVVGVDGRKLWNARLGCRFRSCWTTAESRGLELLFTLEHYTNIYNLTL